MAISNSTQISQAALSLSHTVAQLPDRISAERKEILASLESQEGKFRDLAASMDQMASSLTITLTNAKGLVEILSGGEPRTNGTPFSILDYAKTAEEISAMAQNLNALIGSMNQSAPEFQRMSGQAVADLEKAEDRGFRLGLVLIAVLLIGAVLAGLVYTFFAEKLKRRAAARSAGG